VDLREVALDVVLVARRQLLGSHHFLDDLVVLAVDVAVALGGEALLRGGQDGLARAAALRALLALQVVVLGVAGLLGRISDEVVVVADAPFLAALLALALTGLALALAALAGLLTLAGAPRLTLAALAARALGEILVLVLLAERILAVLVALLLGAPHRLAEVLHLRRHLLLGLLLAAILIDAAGLARGVLELLRGLLTLLVLLVLVLLVL